MYNVYKHLQGPTDPFPVPMFKQDVEESLAEKKFTDDDRKYMCRVLATVLQTHVQRPSIKQCEIVAKALVRKFPFFVSFVCQIAFLSISNVFLNSF